MNKFLLFTLMFFGIICVINAKADNQPTVIPQSAYSESNTVFKTCIYGLKRGIINLTTSTVEIPRCISYEFTARPLSAIIIGPLTGASFTAIRTVLGAVDIVSFGYNGHYKYSEVLPDYAWQSEWTSDTTELD